MQSLYEKMEHGFHCGSDELKTLSVNPDWRIRYGAALGMGLKKDPDFLVDLERMLEVENARPLFTQPVTKFIGTEGDTRLAEQVMSFEVIFPFPVDEDTKEAWKTRGRVIQAILFAIHDIGSAHDSLIGKLHHYIEDPSRDYSVKAAAVRALGQVGDRSSLPYCGMAANIDERCTQLEAIKAIGRIKDREGNNSK